MHIHDDVPRTAILRAARLQSSDVLGRLLVRNVEGRLRQVSSARVQVEVETAQALSRCCRQPAAARQGGEASSGRVKRTDVMNFGVRSK